MKKQILVTSIALLCGTQSGFAESSLSSVSGAWYDPAYSGSGFNMAEFSNGLYAYFYGYKGGSNGDAQWLLTESGIPTPIIVGKKYQINMNAGFVGNGGSFTTKPTTDTSGTQHWGTLDLTFNSCSSGVASLSGLDGNLTHNIVKLAGISGLSCVEKTVDNALCDYKINEYNSSPSVNAQSVATWSCDSSKRYLSGNGIPNHEVGTFPNTNNPNTISAQTVSAELPLIPTDSGQSDSGTIAIAYALNSVKIEPNTDGSCGDTLSSCVLAQGRDTWRIEALGQSTFDFGTDMNNAHVQPTGEYHYHGMPEKLIEKLGGNKDKMTLVAWALDGYPIYARYGYKSPSDASSAIVALKGSYQLKNTPDSGRISISELPMGTFAQDYEYVSGLGDLDDCNGRSGVTPEFPNGTYYYMLTDTYPFAPRCLKGEFTPVMFSEGDPNAAGGGSYGGSRMGQQR